MNPRIIPFALLVCALTSCGTGVDSNHHEPRRLPEGPVSIAASRNIVFPAKTPELFAAAGSELSFTLQWEAAPTGEDLMVFVHFLDRDGVYAFGADYSPPEQTSSWSGHVEHVRTVTVPDSALGTYLVRVGLYELQPPWGRAVLNPGAGVVVDDELRYQVASLTVHGSDAPSPGALRAPIVLPAETPALAAAAGDDIVLTLAWEANPTDEDLNFLVHFVDAAGNTAFADDFAPATSTTVWSGRVTHTRTISIPESATGAYSIRTGLYQAHEPWGRLPLAAAAGVVPDDQTRYAVATLLVDAPKHLPGTVVGYGGKCLEAFAQSYGYPLEYTSMFLADCTGEPAQVWTFAGGQLRNDYYGRCATPTVASDVGGGQLTVRECGQAIATWAVSGDRLTANGLCLETGATNDSSGVSLVACNDGAVQRWVW